MSAIGTYTLVGLFPFSSVSTTPVLYAEILLKEKVTMFNGSTEAPVNEAPYQLIDFFTLELVLLGALVLLAVVLIALKSKAH